MKRTTYRNRAIGAIATGIAGALLHAPITYGEAPESQTRHPQEDAIAQGPRPYENQDVSFVNERAQVKLAGTLSLPNGKGPFPGVLLVAAAGPEGRDEEAGGHRVFVVLADHLLRRGIAVLRYDKRGIGASNGDLDKASFDDLVSDAATAFQYLKTRPEVDRRRLGVIGHSEGGSIAPAVAAGDNDVSFVVAMAGSGLSGEVRITEQQVYLAQPSGASPQQQTAIRTLCQNIFKTVAATTDDVAASSRITALIDKAVSAKTLSAEAAEEMRQLMTPQFVRQELSDEPLKYVKSMHVPMLALVGSLDRIVPPGPYVAVMKPALANIPGSHVEVLQGLNHVMQTAQTGSPEEFDTIEESISPVALKVIGDWVQVHVDPRRATHRSSLRARIP